MKLISEDKNFEFFKTDEPEHAYPFIMACRDYEAEMTGKYDVRWVLACLSEEEARNVFNEMKKYFA